MLVIRGRNFLEFVFFLYINNVAPREYRKSESFRKRYRFLVVRWRPDKWYWGMVYMLRNVFITLVNIFVPNDAVIQCSLMLIFLMVGMVLQSSNRPWRDNRNNYADLYMTFCLCALVVLSFNFANEPSDQGAIYKQSIEQAIIILVVIVTVVFVGLLVYAILLQRNRGVREVIYNLSILQLAGDFSMLGTRLAKADADKFVHALGHYPHVDVEDLKHMLAVLGGASCFRHRESKPHFREWLRASTALKLSNTRAKRESANGIGPRLQSGDSLGTICRQMSSKEELPAASTSCLESSVEVAEHGHVQHETDGFHTSSHTRDIDENGTQSRDASVEVAERSDLQRETEGFEPSSHIIDIDENGTHPREPASNLHDSENVRASVKSVVVGLDTISESSLEIEIESAMTGATMPILSPSARPCFAENNFVSNGASGGLSWHH